MREKDYPQDRLLGRDFVLVCTSNFLAFFSIYLIIPVLPVFLKEQGYSNAIIGIIMSMATIAALLRPLFGRIADNKGRKIVLIWGTLLLAASTFLYVGFASALPLLFIRLLNGLGLAAFHTAAYAIIGDLAPSSRRLQGIAIFYISVDVTIAIAPIAAESMKNAWGFNFVYITAACIAVGAFLITLMIGETRDAEHPAKTPERSRFRVTSLQAAIYLLTVGFTLTFGTLQTFIVLSSDKQGLQNGELFFTVFAATLILFRLGVSRRADRWPRRPLIIISAIISLGGLVIIAYSSNLALLIAGSLIYGIGFAYIPTTLSALLLDHTPVRDRGGALGIFLAVFDIGIGMGGIALGPLADLWGYSAMYMTGGAIALLCLIYFIFSTLDLR